MSEITKGGRRGEYSRRPDDRVPTVPRLSPMPSAGDLYPEGWLVFAGRAPHYGVRKHVDRGWRDRAAGRARMLARAAFLAVPGLRE